MLMNPRSTMSSYLVTPRLRGHAGRWNGFRARALTISRVRNHISPRALASLAIWTVIVSVWQYTTTPRLANQAALANGQQTPIIAEPAPTAGPIANEPAALAAVAHAEKLPDGPTGQLLPPGTMAPDRTYANNYSRGQCTWYVASRRQIPGGWGNAKAWYYHATASGWAVGTVPAVAAVAWTPSGYYGHVALVEQVSADGRQVYVSEMNYRGVGVKSFRWAPTSSFKYIY
ncbi:MAG: hypothetical protein JWN01_882 [Patescibacteria group bacterium]|nr:hypothetical protein [Patescibacteria group bacterium]